MTENKNRVFSRQLIVRKVRGGGCRTLNPEVIQRSPAAEYRSKKKTFTAERQTHISTSKMATLDEQLAKLERKIEVIEIEIEKSSDPEEKKQLRTEKEQLREEKLIFLRRQENSGNSINSMSYQQNEKNLTMPMPLIISPSIHQ
jgi:hypothetical protein